MDARLLVMRMRRSLSQLSRMAGSRVPSGGAPSSPTERMSTDGSWRRTSRAMSGSRFSSRRNRGFIAARLRLTSRCDGRADAAHDRGGLRRALPRGHGGVHPRQIGFHVVAIAEIIGDDGVDVLKREGLVIGGDLLRRLAFFVGLDDVLQADAVAAQADDIGRLEVKILFELHSSCPLWPLRCER